MFHRRLAVDILGRAEHGVNSHRESGVLLCAVEE
jgi:hypothetical protein